MTLYVGFDENNEGKKTTRHTIHFLTSSNLKEWKVTSQTEGLFECPDFFELPVDGDAKNMKWLLTGASSEYMLGSFDGEKFTPETPKLRGHRGKGFYAAQTYSDIPRKDGRRIQFGWLQAPSPGMAFNQAMSLPLELTLRSTKDGARLAWQPVKELIKLRAHTDHNDSLLLKSGATNPLAGIRGELLELRAEFEPSPDSEVHFNLRGIPVVYDTKKGELIVNGHHAPAPLRNGKQSITIYTDRTAIEVFANDGLTYVPMPVIP